MDIDALRAQRLFQAVVAQALIDATSQPELTIGHIPRREGEGIVDYRTRRAKSIQSRQSQYQQQIRTRDVARRWFVEGGADFRRVCSLADYDPNAIRDRAMRLERDGWQSARQKAA